MSTKFVVAGFRHGHIFGLINRIKETADCELVACCEAHAETRANLDLDVQYDDFDKMLSEVECDVVAIGDYYGIRGSLALKALEAGKHVIADKPICTSLDELAAIEKLAAEKNLKVGCMFDLRQYPPLVKLRQLIQDDVLGEIHAVSFTGQHPLNWGVRPSWYFEEGKHGGTINDIAIHGIDYLSWATGMKFTELTAARTWNAFADQCPIFNDSAQFMAKMENGCGVMADVSYAAPSSCGFSLPYYWEFTVWGKKGVARTCLSDDSVKLSLNGDKETKLIDLPETVQDDYFTQFLNELAGNPGELNTAVVIESARTSLKIQQAADNKTAYVAL
ncbi:MAG: Gfo/Idh/MocA family oxidoreductase [Victivallaceae bacterium]|nr:Gfo/Idh/MocA family oxidoreductase [Victivallaceae bacterium]